MARTIEEIQAEIVTSVQADTNLTDLSSTSSTALWRLITRVVAKAHAVLENLYDLFKVDVDNAIAILKPHTAKWYRQKSLDFQLGHNLVDGEDYYDNSLLTPDQIETSQIVVQAAVTEDDGKLTIKVTKDSGGDYTPLIVAEYDAFSDYIHSIKDAGVRLEVLSFAADSIIMEIDIYYDPLILDPTGARLDGTNSAPVSEAANSFLKNLPFDGLFVKAHFVDALQAVDGVFVPEVRSCVALRFASSSSVSVDIEYKPYSGFLRFYDAVDLTLNFIPHV